MQTIRILKMKGVWMMVFVQILDGEVRKWFRELPPKSIDGIDAL